MDFVGKERVKERGERGKAAEDPEHWQSTCRGGYEGSRIGKARCSLSPRQDRQVQRDSRRAGFSRLRSVRRELSDNFSSGSRRHNASEYVSTHGRADFTPRPTFVGQS